MRTSVDTNVISALWSDEAQASSIVSALASARERGGAVVCAPVYVELLAHPKASQSFVDRFLLETGIQVDYNLEKDIWDEAGKAFTAYAERRRRSAGGSPRRLLADFLIGAHASLRADQLMTLDPSRYVRDFPRLRVI
ncbi:MAG: type II toxin-antitoxin system VapC family toxin [Terriglobales bacterium]